MMEIDSLQEALRGNFSPFRRYLYPGTLCGAPELPKVELLLINKHESSFQANAASLLLFRLAATDVVSGFTEMVPSPRRTLKILKVTPIDQYLPIDWYILVTW